MELLYGCTVHPVTTKINPIFGKSLANFVVGDGKHKLILPLKNKLPIFVVNGSVNVNHLFYVMILKGNFDEKPPYKRIYKSQEYPQRWAQLNTDHCLAVTA